jgi:hypothetical protein
MGYVQSALAKSALIVPFMGHSCRRQKNTYPKGTKCSEKDTNGGRKDVATAIRVKS